MNEPLTHEALALYDTLDQARMEEARLQDRLRVKDVARLLQLMRACTRAYWRFERRAKRGI